MSLPHDLCRLFYARRFKAVDPVGRRQQVGRDYMRWLADEAEQIALTLADKAEGIEGGRAINVRGQVLYRTLRHAAALALAEPAFFRDRLAECGETAPAKQADLAKAESILATLREVVAAHFEEEAARFADAAERRRSRGDTSDETEARADAFVARAHEVRAAG